MLWLGMVAAISFLEAPIEFRAPGVTLPVVIQVVAVRPPLSKRTDRVLAGAVLPRSRRHWVYIALELVKVGLLIALAFVLTVGVLPCRP